MGIPKFYRWISERYPLISQPLDTTNNPEVIIPEYENLYLDFNGIIHRCSHPDDINPLLNQLTESDMMLKMFDYVQTIVQLIKPSKVLIIAVDGVAPRAKMNQQRSRRFRSAQDTAKEYEKATKEGRDIPNLDDLFDSNCITPGTPFMEKLNKHFEYFIRKKIAEDEIWKDLNVIFSGHDVPGEGEHKIMSFIRKMKSQDKATEVHDPSFKSFRNRTCVPQEDGVLWDPNATHCMYGLDADLIMLGLVTHEPHFSLLRENALGQVTPPDITVLPSAQHRSKHISGNKPKFQLLHLSVLREYLHEEFKGCLPETGTFSYDLERIIDDFVFMCYFIGNDFLPNLPFLDISEMALNKMFQMYAKNLSSFGDYLTDHGSINGAACSKFLEHVSVIEKETLGVTEMITDVEESNDGELEGPPSSSAKKPKKLTRKQKEKQEQLHTLGLAESDVSEQRKLFNSLNPDQLWKQGYYMQKFRTPLSEVEFHQKLCFDYMQGLAWVLKYYYDGCQSWGWFYPYHYAPLASDLINFGNEDCVHSYESLKDFPPSEPFKPFQQLLGVLPIASKKLLPLPYQRLMTDKDSPMASFYPLTFEMDLNGKRNDWEAIVLIPFINATILKEASDAISLKELSEKEAFRNRLAFDCFCYFYDPEYSGTVAPTLPGSDHLVNIQARKEKLIMPSFETYFTLCDGVRYGKNAPSHFPSMKTLLYDSQLKFVKLDIFRYPSLKATRVIEPNVELLWPIPETVYEKRKNDEDSFITEESVAEAQKEYEEDVANAKKLSLVVLKKMKDMINKVVYSRWPYHEESKVVEITTEFHSVTAKGIANISHTNWKNVERSVTTIWLTKYGINLSHVQALVRVQPLKGITVSPTGRITKLFDENAAHWQPYQLIVESIENSDPRFAEQEEKEIAEMYPLESTVVLTNKKFCGSVATILEHKDQQCKIQINPLPKLNNLPKRNHNQLRDKLHSLGSLSAQFSISKKVLSQLTGTVRIKAISMDVGLNIKFTSRNEKVDGYTVRVNGQWLFTDAAKTLLVNYKSEYPEVFDALMQADNAGIEFQALTDKSFFKTDPKSKLKDLKKYLSALRLSGLERRSASEELMSAPAIAATEPDFYLLCRKLKNQSRTPKTVWVERESLRPPMMGRYILPLPEGNEDIQIGDYICYLRSSNGPSFGSLAIVVGSNPDTGTVHLLFGEEFIGGTDLKGICSAYHGMKDVSLTYCLKLYSPPFYSHTQSSSPWKEGAKKQKETETE